jgi:hypothetical protein
MDNTIFFFVFTIMNINSFGYNFFLFVDVFSFADDNFFPASQIAPLKKMHKLGENGFSGSHNFELGDQIREHE